MNLNILEELVRTAQFEKVRMHLRNLSLSRLKRAERGEIANFANRVGLPLIAIKALSSIFRDERSSKPSPREIIQYGHALRRLGAADEALQVLSRVSHSQFPEVLLQMANSHSTLWEYAEAAPLLREFIGLSEPSSYPVRVAHINLLAASIELEDGESVQKSIDALVNSLSLESTPLLFGNFLELQARWALACGNLAEALVLAEKARSALGRATGTWDALQAEKVIGVANSMIVGRVLPDLESIKARAIASGQWEVWRDCDYHTAKINGDKKLLTHLYFGSPFKSFRKKIERVMGDDLPENYTLGGEAAQRVFEVMDGRLDGENTEIKPGQSVHRLLHLLTSDFYKPFTLLTIHSKIIGGYFDPHHSPNRVHQVMTRFRRWAEENRFGVLIEPIQGSFRLGFPSPEFGFRLVRETAKKNIEAHVIYLNRARADLPSAFSTEQLQNVIGQSNSTTLRLLRKAAADGQVVSIGQGKNRRYKFAA